MDSDIVNIRFSDEFPLGDLTVLPPEVLERVLSQMSPLHLVPMMLSCSMLNALCHNERIWDKVYKRFLPETHKALHVAPNPDYWKFRNASSIKFIYEYVQEKKSDRDEVHTVMDVMKKGADSILVQRASVYVLRRLAYYPAVCDKTYRKKIEHYRSTLGREGAIAATVRVLNRFNEPDVLAGALCAIGNLVIDGDNASSLLDLRGIDSILDAIGRHSESFTVLDYGCFALCNIADDYKFKEAIWKAGAAKVALTAIAESKFRPEELTPPVDLLATLCLVPDVKKQHGRDIIDAVDSLFLSALENAKLMAHVLTLAVLVCENFDENRDYAVSKSFIEKMFRCLDTFDSESETLVFVKTALVLFTLFWRNEIPEMAAHRSRLIHAIVAAMKSGKSDLSLQRTSAAMLSDFAHSDSNLKALIVSLGGRELVRSALNSSTDGDNDPEWSALATFINIDD